MINNQLIFILRMSILLITRIMIVAPLFLITAFYQPQSFLDFVIALTVAY